MVRCDRNVPTKSGTSTRYAHGQRAPACPVSSLGPVQPLVNSHRRPRAEQVDQRPWVGARDYQAAVLRMKEALPSGGLQQYKQRIEDVHTEDPAGLSVDSSCAARMATSALLAHGHLRTDAIREPLIRRRPHCQQELESGQKGQQRRPEGTCG